MEFIPYIGPILSVIPALIVWLGISWDAAIVILILYIIIQQAENNFLVPYIMSRNLDISPLFVFVIMLFGATLGGILGIILSVPIAGVIKVIFTDYIERKKRASLPSPPISDAVIPPASDNTPATASRAPQTPAKKPEKKRIAKQ